MDSREQLESTEDGAAAMPVMNNKSDLSTVGGSLVRGPRAQGSASVYRAKPRDYDGTGSWREYQSQFDRVAELNEWEDSDRLSVLWIHLSGSALSYLEGLPEHKKSTYAEVCAAMSSRFGSERLTMIHKAELVHKSRKRGQSLQELAQEIRRLADYAYPNFPVKARDEVAMEKFIEALDDSALRLHIHQANPLELDEAVEIGTKYEAWKSADGRTHPRVRMVQPAGSQEADEDTPLLIRELQEKIRKIEMGTGKKELVCYYCDKKGHIAKDCFKRKREIQKMVCFACQEKGHLARECPLNQLQGNE